MNNNPFENLKIPELHKNKMGVSIDKDKIPQEKAQWTKKDSVDLSRSLLKRLTTPHLVEEGDNKDYTEWVNKLTDDEAIEIASKISKWLERLSYFEEPVNAMPDWRVLLLTTSALTTPDDAAEEYHNLITSITAKDVEEASKDYETMTNNFNAIFGGKQD